MYGISSHKTSPAKAGFCDGIIFVEDYTLGDLALYVFLMRKKDGSVSEDGFSVKDIVFTNKYVEVSKASPGVKEALNFLGWKLFRKQENERKMNFIIAHSDFDFSLFGTAHALSQPNDYHNFGHQIGVAEAAITFAEAQGCSRQEINLLVVTALLHDAGHTGVARIDDEMVSVELAVRFIPAELCQKLGFTYEQLKNLILATTFSQRGRYDWHLAKIIQDADLGNVSFGPYYRLYASMGLADEFGGDYKKFIHQDQQGFINYLESIRPGGFLSDGAKKIGAPLQASLDTILSWPEEVYEYAYKVKQDDILFDDFQKHIDALIQQ
ncbi:MAG: HD domain-containing protein [candidate division SR1 bacterium]|nr:HD domain-containing protein [candidate division SR1 bacterium]